MLRSLCLALASSLLTIPVLASPLTRVYLPTTALEDTLILDQPLVAAERTRLLQAIDHSLRYLNTPEAATAYADLALPGFTRDRVRRSLQRFRQLIISSNSPSELQRAIATEFVIYQSVGHDGEGSVDFTGYFEPVYAASRVPTDTYRYPLYRRPANLETWALPHPTRTDLEGADGLQASQGPLRGLELVWMRSRLEAFLVQVQGSAQLQFPDGSRMSVGYAGRTDYPYTSIGRSLVEDGKVDAEGLTLDAVIAYFKAHPDDLDIYLPRNRRFIFFRETDGGPPLGTFSVPVTAGRSIATDKSLMPPGALGLITLPMPERTPTGEWQPRWTNRFVLNQDTGGAIQGPGRVDLFVGSGPEAGAQAGQINAAGQLFFLLLRE